VLSSSPSSLLSEVESKAVRGSLNRTRLSFFLLSEVLGAGRKPTFFKRILVSSGTMIRSSSCSIASGLHYTGSKNGKEVGGIKLKYSIIVILVALAQR